MDGNASRQSQVTEEKCKVGNITGALSEAISKLEERLKSCLRNIPAMEKCALEVEKKSVKVEFADWLSTHAEDLERQLKRVMDIMERCEL